MTLELWGLLSTALAIAGVILNNRRRRECFYVWIVSNSLTFCVHAWAGLWSLALRDVVFLVLAFDGLRRWRPGVPASASATAEDPPKLELPRPYRAPMTHSEIVALIQRHWGCSPGEASWFAAKCFNGPYVQEPFQKRGRA